MNLSIVVPCYNEEHNLPLILERFDNIIKNKDVEVILVNNGSTDNSAVVLQELSSVYLFSRIVYIKKNEGYGNGIVVGLRAAKGEFVGYTHADMQTDPGDMIKAFDLIKLMPNPKKSYVKGNRKGRPLFDQVFTWGMSLFESLYMGVKLWDINAQPNIFHKSFVEALKDPPKDFSLDLYFLYMATKKQLDIQRLDVIFPDRIHGESSWNSGIRAKWKFIKRTIDFSLKLKKHY